MVVRIHKLVDDVNPAYRATVRQIGPDARIYGTIESLSHCRFLVALTSKVLDPVAPHQGSEIGI